MKNKVLVGVLMLFALMISGGFGAHKVNASVVRGDERVSKVALLEDSSGMTSGETQLIELTIPVTSDPESWIYNCTQTAVSPHGVSYYDHYGSNTNVSGSYTNHGWSYSTVCRDNSVY